MAVEVSRIAEIIEKNYPLNIAESWDNSGFQINLNNKIENILICLDVTPEIIEEAASFDCGLIISHHPLLFHAQKQIDIKNPVDRCINMLIKKGISLYSAHTSVDNAINGLNFTAAKLLNLYETKFIIAQKYFEFYKIIVFSPIDNTEQVKKVMFDEGAGKFNNYIECAYTMCGTGEFTPEGTASPYIGENGIHEKVTENRIEALVREDLLLKVLNAVKREHPYEEPAIDIYKLDKLKFPKSGIGVYGKLYEPLKFKQFLNILKEGLNINNLRCAGNMEDVISTVAFCGGAAGEYAVVAAQLGADVYITGEIKHNLFIEKEIGLIELGHFDSEKHFCQMMLNYLQNEYADVKYNVSIRISEIEKKPYFYY